jgi:molecular chaperone GrpE
VAKTNHTPKDHNESTLVEALQGEESYASASSEELRRALQQKDAQLNQTLSEYENFRRRIAKENQEQHKLGKRELLLGIIDVLDNFERALQSKSMHNETALTSGVRSIYKQLKQLLEQHQVLSFDSVGQKFDPLLHEALHFISDYAHPEGYIVEEFRKGYVWDYVVLRPALVTVVKNSPAEEC